MQAWTAAPPEPRRVVAMRLREEQDAAAPLPGFGEDYENAHAVWRPTRGSLARARARSLRRKRKQRGNRIEVAGAGRHHDRIPGDAGSGGGRVRLGYRRDRRRAGARPLRSDLW